MVATSVNLVRVLSELGLRRVLPLVADALGEPNGVSNIPITAEEVEVLEEMLPEKVSGFHRKRIMYQVRARLSLLDDDAYVRIPDQNKKYDRLIEHEGLRKYRDMFVMLRREGYPIVSITEKEFKEVGVARKDRKVMVEIITADDRKTQAEAISCDVREVISRLSFAELYTGFFRTMDPPTVTPDTFENFSKSLIQQRENFAHHPFHVSRIIHEVAVELGLRANTAQHPIDTATLLQACGYSNKYGYQAIFDAHGLSMPTRVSILPFMTIDDFGSLGVKRLHAKKLVGCVKNLGSLLRSDDHSVETMSTDLTQASTESPGESGSVMSTSTASKRHPTSPSMRPRGRRGFPEDQPEKMQVPLRAPRRQHSVTEDESPPMPPAARPTPLPPAKPSRHPPMGPSQQQPTMEQSQSPSVAQPRQPPTGGQPRQAPALKSLQPPLVQSPQTSPGPQSQQQPSMPSQPPRTSDDTAEATDEENQVRVSAPADVTKALPTVVTPVATGLEVEPQDVVAHPDDDFASSETVQARTRSVHRIPSTESVKIALGGFDMAVKTVDEIEEKGLDEDVVDAGTAIALLCDRFDSERVALTNEDRRRPEPLDEEQAENILRLIQEELKRRDLLMESRVKKAFEMVQKYVPGRKKPLLKPEVTRAIRHLWFLKKRLVPCDFARLVQLVEKGAQSALKIKDQDIILLLGGTGTGKTTTVLFLSGVQHRNAKCHGSEFLQPSSAIPEELQDFETSVGHRSATKCINAIELPPVHKSSESPVILCDTPGFNDTEGPEMDIANGFVIVRAIQECRSAKPVLLLSRLSLGERAITPLQDMTKLLSSLIDNFEENVGALSFIATRGFKDDTPDDVKEFFAQVADDADMDGQLTPQLKALLDAVAKKMGEEGLIIKASDAPDTLSPRDVLSRLMASGVRIESPKDTFRTFVSPKSMSTVREQFSIHESVVKSVLRSTRASEGLKLVERKLDEMFRVQDLLDDLRDVAKMYEEAVMAVQDVRREKLRALKAQLGKIVGITVTAGPVDEFQRDTLGTLELVRDALPFLVSLDMKLHEKGRDEDMSFIASRSLRDVCGALADQEEGGSILEVFHEKIVSLKKLLLMKQVLIEDGAVDGCSGFVLDRGTADALYSAGDAVISQLEEKIREVLTAFHEAEKSPPTGSSASSMLGALETVRAVGEEMVKLNLPDRLSECVQVAYAEIQGKHSRHVHDVIDQTRNNCMKLLNPGYAGPSEEPVERNPADALSFVKRCCEAHATSNHMDRESLIAATEETKALLIAGFEAFSEFLQNELDDDFSLTPSRDLDQTGLLARRTREAETLYCSISTHVQPHAFSPASIVDRYAAKQQARFQEGMIALRNEQIRLPGRETLETMKTCLHQLKYASLAFGQRAAEEFLEAWGALVGHVGVVSDSVRHTVSLQEESYSGVDLQKILGEQARLRWLLGLIHDLVHIGDSPESDPTLSIEEWKDTLQRLNNLMEDQANGLKQVLEETYALPLGERPSGSGREALGALVFHLRLIEAMASSSYSNEWAHALMACLVGAMTWWDSKNTNELKRLDESLQTALSTLDVYGRELDGDEDKLAAVAEAASEVQRVIADLDGWVEALEGNEYLIRGIPDGFPIGEAEDSLQDQEKKQHPVVGGTEESNQLLETLGLDRSCAMIDVHAAFWTKLRQDSLGARELDLLRTAFFETMTECSKRYSFVVWSFYELSVLPAKAHKDEARQVLLGLAEFLRDSLPADDDLLANGAKLSCLEKMLGKVLVLEGLNEGKGPDQENFALLTSDVEAKLKLLAMRTEDAKKRLILLLESRNYADFVDEFRKNSVAVQPFCVELDEIMALHKTEAETSVQRALEGIPDNNGVSVLAQELSHGLKTLVDLQAFVLEMWTAEWETTKLTGLDVTLDDVFEKLEVTFLSRLAVVSREMLLVDQQFAASERAIEDCKQAVESLLSAAPNAAATIESLKNNLARKEEERASLLNELSRRYDAVLTVELMKEPSLKEIVSNLERCQTEENSVTVGCIHTDSIQRLKTGFQAALTLALDRISEQGTLIDGDNTKLLLFLEEYIEDLVTDDLKAESRDIVKQTAERIKELHAEEDKKQKDELRRNRKNEEYEESLVRELRPIVDKFDRALKNWQYWQAENHSKYIHKLILDGVNRYEAFLAEGKIEFVLRKLPVAYNEWRWYYQFAKGVPRNCILSNGRAWDATSWTRRTGEFLSYRLIPAIHSRLRELSGARDSDDAVTFVRLVVEYLPFLLASLAEELGCDDRVERTFHNQGYFPVQLHKKPAWKNHCDPRFTLRILASGILIEVLHVAMRQAQSKDALESENWDAVVVCMKTYDDARHLVSEMNKGRQDLSREIVEQLDEAVRLFDEQTSTPRNFVGNALNAEKEEICCSWEGHPQLETPVKDDKRALFMELNEKFHKLRGSVERLRADLPECSGLVDTCKLSLKHNLESLKQSLKAIVDAFPPKTDETYDALTRKMEIATTFTEEFDEKDLQNEARALCEEIERNIKESLTKSKDDGCRAFKQQIQDGSVPTDYAVSLLLPVLLSQQKIADRLPNVRETAKELAGDALKEIQQIEDSGPFMIHAIETELKNCGDPVGMTIVSTQSAFGGSTIFDRNLKTSKFTIDDVLDQMEAGSKGLGNIAELSDKEKVNLKSQYDAFEKEFIELIEADMEDLVRMTEEEVAKELLVRQEPYVQRARDCASPTCASVRSMLCNVFGYWCLDFCRESLSNFKGQANGEQNQQKKTRVFDALSQSLRKPHAVQVVSLFRLFGMEHHNANPATFFGSQKEDLNSSIKLKNHLAEILTGQGKSITLAAAATTLALLGYSVDCACYSEYLTDRDYEQFKSMFEAFEVQDRVFYGTFNNLCEKLLDASGSLRSVAQEYLLSGSFAQSARNTSRLKRALLIDEVDVFFKDDFHGSVYRPDAIANPHGFSELVQYAWGLRQNRQRCTVDVLKMSPHYRTIANDLGDRLEIFDELLETLVSDLKTFESHSYICDGGRIGYKEADGSVSYRARVRFQTMFAYFKEFENGTVSQTARDNSVGLVFNCGAFSYAEIPLQYDIVIGVTGTLRTLSSAEKRLLMDKYKIKKSTFVPSVYGSRQLEFAGDSGRDVIICRNSQDWFLAIKQEVEVRLGDNKKRSVLVFFENSEVLEDFRGYAKEYKNTWLVMKETTQDADKPTIIGKATTKGQVTLLTREFGRGTDFYCCDHEVIKHGGVHVIQTFVSEQVSEETQIMGRTARQDQRGSFSMVLDSTKLEKLGLFQTDVSEMINQSKLYSRINEKREELCSQVRDMRVEFEDEIREDHQMSLAFTQAIEARDERRIHGFLKERNEGVRLGGNAHSRTIVALDATSSMSSLLEGAKLAIQKMFTRAYEVIEEETGSRASLQMQFCAYRNYNSEADALLTSSWETSPGQLIDFVSPIRASGGWANEAMELALNHALAEHRIEPVGQVIVVGDAPPNTREETLERRADAGSNPFPEVFFDDVQRELVNEGVTIHAFYIQTWAKKENFEKVAAGPECCFEEIDVSDSQAVETITRVVTERVLSSYVGGGELGQRLISKYREKFCKGYS